jgi:hypothetical protein
MKLEELEDLSDVQDEEMAAEEAKTRLWPLLAMAIGKEFGGKPKIEERWVISEEAQNARAVVSADRERVRRFHNELVI